MTLMMRAGRALAAPVVPWWIWLPRVQGGVAERLLDRKVATGRESADTRGVAPEIAEGTAELSAVPSCRRCLIPQQWIAVERTEKGKRMSSRVMRRRGDRILRPR